MRIPQSADFPCHDSHLFVNNGLKLESPCPREQRVEQATTLLMQAWICFCKDGVRGVECLIKWPMFGERLALAVDHLV